MKSSRLFDRRAGFSFASLAILLSMVVPAAFPAFASAYATLPGRSIEMSNSGNGQTGVTYSVSFTPSAAISANGGFIVDFCDDSPIIGGSCTNTPPTGFTATGAALGTGSSTAGTVTATAGQIKFVTSATMNASALTYNFTGITNPTAVGTFYARIYTYTSTANFSTYSSITSIGSPQDAGGIAMSTTNTIGVSAIVRETMTFCVSGSNGGTTSPGTGCGTNVVTPGITLGHGSPLALDSTAVDTALDYAQISTNAGSGVNVRMTNSNACGGLYRAGATVGTCDIPPVNSGSATPAALATGSTTGGFGLNVGSQAYAGTGFGTVTGSSHYTGSSVYGMYVNSGSGVNSTYGDSLFSSTGPVGNINVPLTFGAVAGTTTPAGQYNASINLVATGTF